MATKDELGGMFIFSVIFLGMLAFLGGMMSIPDLSVDTMRNQTIPEYFWDSNDLTDFYDTWYFKMNETGGFQDGLWYVVQDDDLGGHKFSVNYMRAGTTNQYRILFYHYFTAFIFEANHDMKWRNTQGLQVSEEVGSRLGLGMTAQGVTNETLDDEFNLRRLDFNLECSHIQISTFMAFNETLYTDVSEAWDNQDLDVLVGIGFNQTITAMNGWSLVSSVLFFDMPNVHPAMNFLISAPIWACIIYVTVRLLLLFIPFVG